MSTSEPIHIYLPADRADPRKEWIPPEGVIVHRGPRLHPDDVDEVDGLPVTSVSRTLIDMAEIADREELYELFEQAHARGLLDPVALAASRARVEWRPSLALFDEVSEEFGV